MLSGFNTRTTDTLRDETLLLLSRKAGLLRVLLRTEAAALEKLDRFCKETAFAQNKNATEFLKRHCILTAYPLILDLARQSHAMREAAFVIYIP